MLTYEVMS